MDIMVPLNVGELSSWELSRFGAGSLRAREDTNAWISDRSWWFGRAGDRSVN